MKIVTLLNEKGGVGKTTLATHIAAGLAMKGYRVVLVDADPQGHAAVTLGMKKEPALYDLLVREAPFDAVMREVPPEQFQVPGVEVSGTLHVIASNVETRSIPLNISNVFVVQRRFRELQDVADFVIFDTPPTPSLLHGSINVATDGILFPTKCEYLSFDGLAESLAHRKDAQPMRQELGLENVKVLGIVPTMYRANTVAHAEGLRKLQERFGAAVWDAIPMRTAWVEASVMRQLVFNFAPDSEATADAWRVINRIEEGMQS